MQSQQEQHSSSYQTVIHRAIEAASQQGRGGIAGFYMLQGPTGSGKSSALYRGAKDGSVAVLEFLQQQKQGKFPAILVTHRWNILQDIYKETVASKNSKGRPYRVSMLYGQTDTVSAAVQQKPLSHEAYADTKDFPSFVDAIEQFDAWQLFAQAKDKSQLTRNCRAVRNISHYLEQREKYTPASFLQNERDELGKLCGLIESALLKIMTALEEEVAQLQGVDTEPALLKQAQKKLADFRAQPWVRRIFPAIAWRDEQHDLLVMTTHKLLYSFYDGIRKVRLSSPSLAGYVIFIDEFDYQADVFQSLLAQAQKIQELPICIALLLEKGNELIQRIQHDPRSDVQRICELLSDLLTELKTDLDTKSIDLSSVNNFVMPLDDFKAGRTFQTQYLFRADHLATREPLFLRKTEQGFAVVQGKASQKGDIDVGQFLRLMEGYLRRYTNLFSHPAWTDSNAFEYLRQLNALLFDSTNDYQTSYYSRVLPEMAHFTLPVAHVPELKPLLNSNVLPHTQANLHGFTTWLLKGSEEAYAMDKQRLQVKRAFMPTTAEGLLVALASRNLVFGLSATAYIERALGHFDVRWVSSALRYIAQARDPQFDYSYLGDCLKERKDEWLEKPIPYLASATDLQQQLSMIKNLTRVKADIRATDLLVREESFFAAPSMHYQELIQVLPSDFFSNEGSYESVSVLERRQTLLIALLRVLKVAAEREQHQGHLVFVNSSRHLRQLLSNSHKSLLIELIPWFLDEPDFYASLSRRHALYGFEDVFVSAQLLQRPAFICFLNAENQKRSGFMQAYQAAFATGRTVIVVAQAASATNGINLDFTVPDSGLSSDLTCLYLLESHHFYFSTAQGQTDAMTHAGMQLRDLDKLRRFSQLSRADHRRFLSPLMAQEANSISQLNAFYKQTEDMCKNVAADVQQQVGRIERAWTSVPEVEIYIEPDIASILRNFYSLPTYQNNKNLVSELNQRLLSELSTATADDEWLKLLSTPTQSAKKAVDWIDNKLVPAVRRARTDKKLFTQIEPIWRNLGRAVLQYDLLWQAKSDYLPAEPLKDWACVVRPDAGLPPAKLWYNPSTWQFFPSAEQGCRVFDLESLYLPIQHNPAILDWFRHKDYRTSLVPFANEVEERFVLHPLVVQRILQGRLGEESVRALLDDAGVKTTADYADHAVFEVYDFAIVNSPFRVDAKYWSSYSLDRADALFVAQESESSPFTDFAQALKTMRAIEGQHTRLLVINLLTAGSGHSLIGLTVEGQHVAVGDADIVVLEGCLSSQSFAVTEGFKKLVSLINEVGQHE